LLALAAGSTPFHHNKSPLIQDIPMVVLLVLLD
jgi:hypothetical protein